MATVLGDAEPAAGPWRVAPIDELIRLIAPGAAPIGRPRIVAVDGRGGGGKTTLAERLRARVPDAVVVHTDDVAWGHSRFGWADLLIGGILEPLHRGASVSYRPPGWEPAGRDGHLDIPAAPLVVIEGVGASRREVTGLIDAAVWVQSDFAEARRRGLARDRALGRGDEESVRIWDEWMVEEIPFFVADRPWERAAVIVGSTPDLAHDPVTQVVIAPPLAAGDR